MTPLQPTNGQDPQNDPQKKKGNPGRSQDFKDDKASTRRLAAGHDPDRAALTKRLTCAELFVVRRRSQNPRLVAPKDGATRRGTRSELFKVTATVAGVVVSVPSATLPPLLQFLNVLRARSKVIPLSTW